MCWMLLLLKTVRLALQHSLSNCARARTHAASSFKSYLFLETDERIALLTCKAHWALPVMAGNVECNCPGMLSLSISHSLVTVSINTHDLFIKILSTTSPHPPPSSLSLTPLWTATRQPAALGPHEGMWDYGKEQQSWALSQRLMSSENRHSVKYDNILGFFSVKPFFFCCQIQSNDIELK